MPASLADRLAIRALMENWGLYRDARDWKRFRALWHSDGIMVATWFQGPVNDFIKVSEAGFKKGEKTGASIIHMLGATTVDIRGKRAIAQSKSTILQRGEVDGVMCDVACHGRFYAFIEKRKGRWGMVLLRPIYEKDRIDPVDPSKKLKLDARLLAKFPAGYHHLAYLQSKAGFDVKRDLPGLSGPALKKLYAAGAAWLGGKPLPRGGVE